MKVLAVDHGLKRIGFAVSDDEGIFARAVETIETSDRKTDIEATLEQIESYKPEVIVVGDPRGHQGKPTRQSNLVTAYIKHLRQFTDITVKTWEESYTSQLAEEVIRQKKSGQIDSEAARIILQEYLDFTNTGI